MYIRSPETPRILAQQHRVLYQFLLEQVVLRRALRLPLRSSRQGARHASSGRRATAGSSNGYGPNGIAARVVDVTDRVVRLQTGYLYHYAFAMLHRHRGARYLDDAREFLLMTDWPILSTVTFLPLVGVALLLLMRDDSATGRRNILNISLLTTIVTFVVSLLDLDGASTMPIPASR